MSFPTSLREFQNLSAQQWLDRASRSLPQALSVVLVIAIAWQLVQLTWLLLDSLLPAPAFVAAPSPVAATPVRKGVDIQSIVAAHLFGLPQAEQAQDAGNAPQTQMNLVLSAVFAANDPTKGLAIIGESAQSSKVYAAGASVRQGTSLHEVYSDRVILNRGGQLEALLLPRPSTAGIAMNRPPPPPAPNTQLADNIRRIAATNPGAFAEVIRPQPVFANGVQRGYRVYPGRNRQAFTKLGLVAGDLILAINGTPLDDPQRGMEIFNTISTMDRVNLTIERNGQPQELTLNSAQITLPEAGNGNGNGKSKPTQPPAGDAAPPAQ